MASHVDLIIVRFAARQHGVVSARQLQAHGVASSTINRRVATGVLQRLSKGVYLVTGMEQPRSRLAAALLLTPAGVASHRTAARLHGMPVSDRGVVEISAPKGRISPTLIAVVHETRSMPTEDVVEIDGLRVTSPARTLCDLATSISAKHLTHAVQTQLVKGSPSARELVACHRALARKGRTGTVMMREILLAQLDDQPFPQSELELRALTAFVEHGITYLQRQFAPPWYDGVEGIVDFADPVGRTILEADGRHFHTVDQDRLKDRERDRLAARHGWLVIRIGWQEVVERTAATMYEIGEILESRRNLAA